MPGPLIVIPPIVKLMLSTVIGAKLVAIAANWIVAPTSAGTRKVYVEHVEHVLEGLNRAQIGVGQSDLEALHTQLEVLRVGIDMGWTTPEHSAALVHTFKFLSWAHTKSTAFGVGEFAASHASAAGTALWNFGARALNAVFPRK